MEQIQQLEQLEQPAPSKEDTISLIRQINRLKQEKKAVILAHNYQRPEILDVADIQGDSLELSRAAARTEARVIVFCGVRFMAETASILCPDKVVLLPEADAGCPLANYITVPQLQAMRQKYPEATVVCYVNSSAEVKAASDICCTSANAVRVVNSLDGVKQVLMVPDKHLALYVSRHTDKEVIAWEGGCPAHCQLQVDEVLAMKTLYPKAKFMAHPECDPHVLELADCVTSTSGMLRYVDQCGAKEFIVGTEEGMTYVLRIAFPDKTFYHFPHAMICQDMKRVTLASVVKAMEEMHYVVSVSDKIRKPALACLSRMMNLG
ncbi:MAG: quinolinate synthase NadA [bacterium]